MNFEEKYARYYDLFYREKPYYREASFIDELLAPYVKTKGQLLELGCGSGRYTKELLRLGYKVDGLDLSAEMLACAKENLKGEDSSKFTFTKGDARTFSLPRKDYELSLALFHVVSYMRSTEDLRKMLKSVHAHLRLGGLFAFDFWHGPGVFSDPPTFRQREVFDEKTGKQITRESTPTLFLEENVVQVGFKFFESPTDQRTPTYEEDHYMRFYFIRELEDFLADAGFKILKASPWMDNTRKLEPKDWYAFVICQKVSSRE